MGSGYIAPQGRPPTDWAQRLFALRKRRGELPETTKEAADIALVVVLDAADNLLPIRRSKQLARSGAWENPLGHSEAGETDAEAAQRELEEETGLTAEFLPETTTIQTPNGQKTIRLFVGRLLASSPRSSSQPSEHDQHRWVHPTELSKVPQMNRRLVGGHPAPVPSQQPRSQGSFDAFFSSQASVLVSPAAWDGSDGGRALTRRDGPGWSAVLGPLPLDRTLSGQSQRGGSGPAPFGQFSRCQRDPGGDGQARRGVRFGGPVG